MLSSQIVIGISSAKNSIGLVRESIISTETRTLKVYQTNYKSLVYMDSLCMTTIVDALVDASYLFGYRKRKTGKPMSDERKEEAREAYAFISGTGLDAVIEFYGMDLDADKLRGMFLELWTRK